MSAPYYVWRVSPYRDVRWPASSFKEAVKMALKHESKLAPHERIRVIGDGYDCDADQDGFYECSNGLTETETEIAEALGVA